MIVEPENTSAGIPQGVGVAKQNCFAKWGQTFANEGKKHTDTHPPDEGVDTSRCFKQMFPAVVCSRSSSLRLNALRLAVSCRRRQRRGNAGALRRVLRGQWTPTRNEPFFFFFFVPWRRCTMFSCSRIGKLGKVMEFANAGFQARKIQRML